MISWLGVADRKKLLAQVFAFLTVKSLVLSAEEQILFCIRLFT